MLPKQLLLATFVVFTIVLFQNVSAALKEGDCEGKQFI